MVEPKILYQYLILEKPIDQEAIILYIDIEYSTYSSVNKKALSIEHIIRHAQQTFWPIPKPLKMALTYHNAVIKVQVFFAYTLNETFPEYLFLFILIYLDQNFLPALLVERKEV